MIFLATATHADQPLKTTLEAARSITQFAYINGIATEVPIREGQAVMAGDTLVRLEAMPWEVDAKRNHLALGSAERRYKRLQLLEEQGGASLEQVEQASIDLQIAQVRWNESQHALSHTTIRSLLRGHISAVYIRPGEPATTGQRLFQIIDATDLKAVFYVAAERIAAVSLHASVQAHVENQALILEGFITSISPLIDTASGTCKVEALFHQAGSKVRPGTVVDIYVE